MVKVYGYAVNGYGYVGTCLFMWLLCVVIIALVGVVSCWNRHGYAIMWLCTWLCGYLMCGYNLITWLFDVAIHLVTWLFDVVIHLVMW